MPRNLNYRLCRKLDVLITIWFNKHWGISKLVLKWEPNKVEVRAGVPRGYSIAMVISGMGKKRHFIVYWCLVGIYILHDTITKAIKLCKSVGLDVWLQKKEWLRVIITFSKNNNYYCSKPPKFQALFLCSDSFSQDGYIVSFVTQN